MIITGTGTGVGKTVVTAAVAALAAGAGERVVVLKPAQTGIAPGAPGDLADVTRLTGGPVTTRELARYPEPLAPATAARRSGLAPLRVAESRRPSRPRRPTWSWSRVPEVCSCGSTTRARPWPT